MSIDHSQELQNGTSPSNKIMVLFGSETGTAEEYAFDLYNQDDKYKKRVLALINGGYLFERNNQINFNTNFRNKMILHLILFLKK